MSSSIINNIFRQIASLRRKYESIKIGKRHLWTTVFKSVKKCFAHSIAKNCSHCVYLCSKNLDIEYYEYCYRHFKMFQWSSLKPTLITSRLCNVYFQISIIEQKDDKSIYSFQFLRLLCSCKILDKQPLFQIFFEYFD